MSFIVSDMDSTGVLIAQMYQKIQKAARIFFDVFSNAELVRRESQGGTMFLPTGAIIGIAVAGSIILFGIFATIIIHCVRSRHKRSKKSRRTRDLDLSDDNEEDVFDALRSTRPPETDLTRPKPLRLSHIRKDSAPKEWDEGNKYFDPPLTNQPQMPPAYALQVTDLRDSWPLVGWAPTPASGTSTEKRSMTSETHSGQRPSYSALMQSCENEPSWPKRTLSRSASSGRFNEDRSVRRSNHSTNPSITSINMLSNNRRSVSDNQLTSILRSTSQRLRDAQRRPMSRAMSVMSQESGAPPAAKPPSPPSDQRGASQEALLDLDDALDADSVRSSVLNTTSHTPSPLKRFETSSRSITEKENLTATTAFDPLNTDIFSLSETPDLALVPLSKRGVLLNHGTESQIPYSFRDDSSKRPDGSIILSEKNHRDGTATDGQSNGPSLENDPFIYSKKSLESRPSSHVRVSLDMEQEFISGLADGVPLPLRDISGNQKTPNKSRGANIDASLGKNSKPFQWSSDVQSLVASLAQKPTGIKTKGHRRHRTVRFSHVPRPVSVGIVFEEPECDTTPPQMLKSGDKPVKGTTAAKESLSHATSDNESSDMMPSIAPIFHSPFLAIPPPETQSESKRSSTASYSATLSFYDYYSSSSLSRVSSPYACPSPTPSMKKDRRRGRNFSIDTSKANSLALTSFSPLKPLESAKTVEYDGTLASLIQEDPSPPEISAFATDSPFMARPVGSTRLFGPRALPEPSPVDSVTSSISLLRRMNSEVSTYSTSSLLSDQSRGSPTMPQFRGHGTSPTRRGHSGTMNYLSIGNSRPSSRGRIGQGRELVLNSESRSRVSVVSKNQGVGEEPVKRSIPATKYSPRLPSLDFITNLEGQNDHPYVIQRPKAPIAQLRPLGTPILALKKCQTCKEPLSGITPSQHHPHCLLCTTCKASLEPHNSYTIDNLRYCPKHYSELKRALRENDADRVRTSNSDGYTGEDGRWSRVMTTPQKTSVRRESKLEMPAPKGLSPKSVIEWRGSLGLYDDMGFLRSSPDKARDADLSGSPGKRLTIGDLGLKL